MRIINKIVRNDHMCEDYPKAFKNDVSALGGHIKRVREFEIRPASIAFFIVCPYCGIEILNSWEFKEAKYYSTVSPSSELLNDYNSYSSYINEERVKHANEEEMYTKYKDKAAESAKFFAELYKNESTKIRGGITCPVCENKIEKDGNIKEYVQTANEGQINELLGFNRWREWPQYNNSEDVIERIFTNICENRMSEEKKKAKEKVDGLIGEFESRVFDEGDYVEKEDIKDNTENLKEFLLAIITLEKNKNWLSERLEQLYFNMKEVTILVNQDQGMKTKPIKDEIALEEKHCEEYNKQLAKLDTVTMESWGIKLPLLPSKPTEPIYEKPGFFNKKRVLDQNAERMKTYENACKKYEEDMQVYNQQMIDKKLEYEQWLKLKRDELIKELEISQQKLNDLLASSDEKMKAVLLLPSLAFDLKEKVEGEIKEAERLLEKTILGKNKLYGSGIVFGKYRDMVAVSTFYEYLLSGRCDTLEGTQGAYNIFEAETRANVIISDLSKIKESVEIIKNNQYMIYSELKNISNNLTDLKLGMSKTIQAIRNDLNGIAKNTELTAYYSKVNAYYAKMNAELTKSLRFLVAIK